MCRWIILKFCFLCLSLVVLLNALKLFLFLGTQLLPLPKLHFLSLKLILFHMKIGFRKNKKKCKWVIRSGQGACLMTNWWVQKLILKTKSWGWYLSFDKYNNKQNKNEDTSYKNVWNDENTSKQKLKQVGNQNVIKGETRRDGIHIAIWPNKFLWKIQFLQFKSWKTC